MSPQRTSFPTLPSAARRHATSLSTSPARGIGKDLRNGLAGAAILLILTAVCARVMHVQERASERARAEKAAAIEQKLASQLRRAEEIAAAREASLRVLLDQEQLRVDAERQQRQAQAESSAVGSSDVLVSGIVLVTAGASTSTASSIDGDADGHIRSTGSVSRVRIPDALHPCRSSEPASVEGQPA
jgi:hypothetical protein